MVAAQSAFCTAAAKATLNVQPPGSIISQADELLKELHKRKAAEAELAPESTTLKKKLELIQKELGIDEAPVATIITKANEDLGVVAKGSLKDQADHLLKVLGICLEES